MTDLDLFSTTFYFDNRARKRGPGISDGCCSIGVLKL
jgi:hypothetical protein